MKDTIIYSGF